MASATDFVSTLSTNSDSCVICKPGVAAGIDAPKRLQIHADVQRQAVIAAAASDAQADAGELAPST